MPGKPESAPLNVMFVHQNFPAQYRHLAPALAARGHQVVALGRRTDVNLPGVRAITYPYLSKQSEDILPLARDLEVKLIRGEAVAQQCRQLQEQGFTPDVIYVHPAWGEALFLRDVFPRSRIIVYCEYFYSLEGQDMGYDPEFPTPGFKAAARLRVKNTCALHAFCTGDVFVSPSNWQRSTYPADLQNKIQVIHEGFDFEELSPDPDARLVIPDKNLVLTRQDKVLSYVARNLEPLRGFHWLMRALPEVQRAVPDAHVVILGGSSIGYGATHPDGKSWYRAMLEELAGKIDLDRIHFLGFVDRDVYQDVLNVSSVHAYLSYPFVLSWSALEAHMMGCNMVVLENDCSMEFLGEHQRIALEDLSVELPIALIKQLQNNERFDELAISRRQVHLDLSATLEQYIGLMYSDS